MSDSEFYHEALVRRLRDRHDCDDDIRGACDEIEDCYEANERLEAEVARLRLTDEEREAVQAASALVPTADVYHLTPPAKTVADTLRNLLERTK